ncbi:hypothetical protein CEXT_808351 [Caerostris extrusa]|uniref:Uncharacterized protein n=1 Tax=Caerostris extrusa TaxID=172846 RepID=A0AAV4NAX4_CAEEX|nr:hypothetical protein CEXT_808351 [Caerostris extrusa]
MAKKERERKKFSGESRFLGYKICIGAEPESLSVLSHFAPIAHPLPPHPGHFLKQVSHTPRLRRGFCEGIVGGGKKEKKIIIVLLWKKAISRVSGSRLCSRAESRTSVASTKFAPERRFFYYFNIFLLCLHYK